jgi:alpha-N-arabinofuranosidase
MANWRKENGSEKAWEMKFFGVGNESWGCGGNMRPEYYADLYRRYQTYVRNYTDKPVYKIACGPNVDDYNWMEQVMKIAAPYMDGISLHHYSLVDGWTNKRPATNFPEKEWFSLIDSAKKMDELITKHSTIMDKYDPDKRVGLIVDEWGSWFSVENGTNPGFLYQQNTIRDAMVASLTLNIFHRHADRVKMANIAQMVNVLQAMLLTEGDKMIKTPTYHVFDLYKHHQDAELIDTYGEAKTNTDFTVSKKDGQVAVSVVNYNIDGTEEMEFDLSNFDISESEAWIVAGDKMDAHNTFENSEVVAKADFKDFSVENNIISVTLPAMSVATILLKG